MFAFGEETQTASKVLEISSLLNWWWVHGFSSYLLYLISYILYFCPYEIFPLKKIALPAV